MNRNYIPALIIVLSLSISCSKSDSIDYGGNNNTGGGGATTSNTINISSTSFSLSSLSVKLGTTVTWKNNVNVVHTATSNNGTTFYTGDIAAGASATYTTNTTGTFAYHCNYHSGMTGTLIVTN
jgi:plastocyanin